MKYRADIDGLRAVAVVAVMLFHAGFETFGGGFVGVDVFFVISGFLITGLIRDECARGAFSFRAFYLRRARRLLPALLATLLLSLAAGYWMLPPSDMRALGQAAVAAILSLSNMLFWLQSGYFDTASDLKPLLHTWSLSVEEQFYLIWPLSLVLLLRFAPRAWVPGLIAAGVVGSLLACELALRIDPSAAFFFLPFRAFELGLGALLVFVPPLARERNALREAMAAAGLGMILAAVFLYSGSTRFPGIPALLPCVGAALVLHGGQAKYVGALLRHRIVRGIGLISYSLYLVHWPLIVFYRFRVDAPLAGADRWGLIAMSVVLAVPLYFFVERTFRQQGSRDAIDPQARPQAWRGRNRVALAGLAAMLVVAAVPAISAWHSDGWKRRFATGPEAQALLAGRGSQKRPQAAIAHPRARMAVVGDSHTVHMHLGLMEWGEAHDVVVDRHYLGGGCPPLLGVSVFGDIKQSLDCDRTRDAALEAIAAADYDVVVLAARWGLYSGVLTAKDHQRPRLLATDRSLAGYPDQATSHQAFLRGLAATAELMARGGARVLFVGQVPPLGKDPYACIEIQDTLQDVLRHCRNAPIDQMLGETEWSLLAAQAVRASYPDMWIFDPRPGICTDGHCMMLLDGVMLYNDGNHLNNAGSRFVVKRMSPMLDALVDATSQPAH